MLRTAFFWAYQCGFFLIIVCGGWHRNLTTSKLSKFLCQCMDLVYNVLFQWDIFLLCNYKAINRPLKTIKNLNSINIQTSILCKTIYHWLLRTRAQPNQVYPITFQTAIAHRALLFQQHLSPLNPYLWKIYYTGLSCQFFC